MRERGNGNVEGDLLKGLAAGVIGGLVGTWTMSQFQNLLTKLSDDGESSDSGGGDEPATVKAAEAVSENVFGHELAKSEKPAAGEAAHYAMGAASGAIYGVMSEFAPTVTVGAGIPFGGAVWLIADNITVPVLGLSKAPTEYPLSTHAYALTSHMIFGLTTEIVRGAVRRAL